jgi:hypothetical protein
MGAAARGMHSHCVVAGDATGLCPTEQPALGVEQRCHGRGTGWPRGRCARRQIPAEHAAILTA